MRRTLAVLAALVGLLAGSPGLADAATAHRPGAVHAPVTVAGPTTVHAAALTEATDVAAPAPLPGYHLVTPDLVATSANRARTRPAYSGAPYPTCTHTSNGVQSDSIQLGDVPYFPSLVLNDNVTAGGYVQALASGGPHSYWNLCYQGSTGNYVWAFQNEASGEWMNAAADDYLYDLAGGPGPHELFFWYCANVPPPGPSPQSYMVWQAINEYSYDTADASHDWAQSGSLLTFWHAGGVSC
jgi:hypothetical protein